MARFTRKFLKALGIEDENVQDQLVSAYREEIDTIAEERDKYKEDAEKLPKVEKERDTLKAQLDENGENPFEGKYKALKKEFDEYKADVTAKETKRAKKDAYTALLQKIGINNSRIEAVVKVAEAFGTLDKLELNENGEIIGEEELANDIKTEWADFLVKTEVRGANTPTPPSNNTTVAKTREEIAEIKDTAERQREYGELYLKGGI